METGQKLKQETPDPCKRWDVVFSSLFALLLVIFFAWSFRMQGSFFFLIYPFLPLLLLSAYLIKKWRHIGKFSFRFTFLMGILALLVSCILFSLEIRHRIHRSAPPAGFKTEIEQGREKINRLFGQLLGDMKTEARRIARDPDLHKLLRPPVDRAPIFEHVEKIPRIGRRAFGLTIYDKELNPLAWWGKTTSLDYLPTKITSPDTCGFFLSKNEMTSTLMAAFPIMGGKDGLLGYGVLEKLLAATYNINNRFLQDMDVLASSVESPFFKVAIDYLETGIDHRDLADFFERFEGNYWGRISNGLPILRFPLTAPDSTLIASATIEARKVKEEEYYPVWFWAVMAAVLLAAFGYPVLLLAGISSDRERPASEKLFALIGCIALLWSFRILLQNLVLEKMAYRIKMASPDMFYLYGIFNLWSSPLAFSLTLAVLFVTLCLAVFVSFRWPGFEIGRAENKTQRSGILNTRVLLLSLMSVIAAQAAIIYFLGFLERVLRGTTINLAGEALFTLRPESLLLRLSLSFLFLSLFLFLLLVFFVYQRLAGKSAGRTLLWVFLLLWSFPVGWLFCSVTDIETGFPYFSAVAAYLLIAPLPAVLEHYWRRRRLPPGKITLGLIILGIFYGHILFFPGFFSLSIERKKQYIRDEVTVWFKDEEAKKKECMWQILKSIPKMKNLDRKLIPDEGFIAYSIWSATSLPSKGYDSGLVIFDVDGNPISRFALNTPLPDEPGAPGAMQSLRGGSLLTGTEQIIRNGSVAGYVTAVISMAPDNVYFMISDSPYKELFRSAAGEKLFEGLPDAEPTLEIYTLGGDLLYSSEPLPQFVDPEIFRHPEYYEEPQRVEGQKEGMKQDTIIFRSEGKLIALSYPQVTPILWMTSLIDFLLLSFILLFCAFVVWWFFSILRGPERKKQICYPLSWLASRFYRKLFVSLLFIAVIPMLFLSYLITSSLKNKIESDTKQLGLEAAAVAGQLFTAFYQYSSWDVEVPFNKYEILSDELADWVSDWIRREVHIYVNDRLVASSIRELFSSGLLSDRLDGEVYQEIVLNRRHYCALPQTIGSMKYQVINIPLDLEGIDGQAVLAIPMNADERKVAAEVKAARDSIFVLSSVLALIASVVGLFLSNRISRPVKDLVEGTEEIARGNFDFRVKSGTKDEIRTLVESFQNMAVALKQQRLDLKKRSEYIEKILINVTAGVISLDPEGFVATANPSALNFLDTALEALKGEPFTAFLKKNERFAELGGLLEMFLRKDLLREVRDLKVKREREEQQLKTVFTRLLDEREKPAGTLILMEDVSDVVRSNRLAAWAEMARIIAHEVKNPLTPIQLAIEHLVRVHEDRSSDFDNVFKDCSETIMKQVQNLRRISKEFSSYARLPKPEYQVLEAAPFLREVLEPYQFSISQNIEIRLSAPKDDELRIRIDPELMRRAFTNVVENALQAMPDGGILDADVVREEKAGRAFALFTIRDNGHGIDEDTYRHLFDPYFSTKKSGVGLGLAIVKRTVREHGGTIQIDSVKGKGTTVSIRLPMIESE